MLSLKHNVIPLSIKLVNTKRYNEIKCSYDSKLQKKYKLMHNISLCDKFLKINHDKALSICDVKKPLDLQPECKKYWKQLESYAIIRNELKNQLQHIDDQLAEFE